MKFNNSIHKDIDLMSLITQIPISLVSANGETLYCPTREDHHYLNTEMAKQVIDRFLASSLPDNTPFIHLYSLNILQGVIQLSQEAFILIGPVCITQFTLESSIEAFSLITTMDEVHRLSSLLEKFIPIDFFRFAGVLASISNNHKHTDFTPSDIVNANFKQKIDVEPLHPLHYATTTTIPISSILFFLQSLYSIVSVGNMDALVKHWQDNLVNTLINLNLVTENIHYLCIPFYSYMFQGAIDGGANINLCFEKYSSQVARFKRCSNIVECITELKRSSYEYCNLVSESKNREYMPEICSQCVSYINDHIQEKITVDDLCHICGIHRNKLYDIFHAHFNMTISEYIEKERLRRAVIYLESSNYTLSEISSTMGYANQSHFTSIFKKHYGCTPRQYMKAHQKGLSH